MKIQHVLAVSLLLGSSVWAQPAGAGPTAAAREAREQRRAEMRQALQSSSPAPAAAPRQLSPQERQALREQLRQQRAQPSTARPQP